MWPSPTSAGRPSQTQFGFEPCYVNSRLAARGIPVACEVDIYGALSRVHRRVRDRRRGDAAGHQQLRARATCMRRRSAGKFDYTLTDTFMGFHCGNTPELQAVRRPRGEVSAHPAPPAGAAGQRARLHPRHAGGRHRRQRHHLLPPAVRQRGRRCAPTSPRARCCRSRPAPSAASACSPSRKWAASTATCCVGKRYPHHGAVAFGHYGKALFEVFKYPGRRRTSPTTSPRRERYPQENPFC